ncbi:MAG: NUDIX domain-containing protein [Actinobacteria bacterium]|nr:NUDIX domain-containing protein [Actinomycetota bacterium]
MLHRLAPGGADYEGEWAWTPPSGARQPGETPEEAAARELREEIGLALSFVPAPAAAPSEDVALYVAQAPSDARVVLDDEHDRFVWLPLAEAVARCLPPEVGAGIANAAAWLDARASAWIPLQEFHWRGST